jgi:hypothetical protein
MDYTVPTFTTLKPNKAFAVAFAALALALAGCASGLGVAEPAHTSQLAHVAEGTVLASTAVNGGHAQTVRLRSGELVTITQADAVAPQTLVLVEFGAAKRVIPQIAPRLSTGI